jgi:transcriptional regulator with XRE-family HTH domain
MRRDEMIIAERLRAIREEKDLSQGEVERRTGLLRCYISRVENGHTVPALETLEKMARAYEMPLYQLFYDGESPVSLPPEIIRRLDKSEGWGMSGKNGRYLEKLRKLLGKMEREDRELFLHFVQQMASRRPVKT